jgi:hypothetical protein
MKEEINSRFRELLEEGDQLVGMIPRGPQGANYWIADVRIGEYQSWIASAVNLIEIVAPTDSHFRVDATQVLKHSHLQAGIPTTVVRKILGLLKAAFAEWQARLLGKIEYIIAAATFDDFLDHAGMYHKANKKIEAAVLVSAVFEDTIRKISQKHNISPAGQSLEQLVDELQKNGVFTPVKAKRVKGFAAVRNRALHAEWDTFDIRDVGEAIAGTRELLEGYL